MTQHKSFIQTVKDTTPQDVLLTGVFAGVMAGISGVGNWIDKNITSYTMGFKSNLSHKQLFLRGSIGRRTLLTTICIPFCNICS